MKTQMQNLFLDAFSHKKDILFCWSSFVGIIKKNVGVLNSKQSVFLQIK